VRARLLACLALASIGCRQDMHDQPKYEPYEKSAFFADGRSARPQVEGTVARGQLREDAVLYTGRQRGTLATALPIPLDQRTLRRGRERYDIFCSPCHGYSGAGDGVVVRRGYRRAASFHTDRLRQQPVGYVFDVVTNGFGAMPDYAAQIPVEDRWAIAAYVEALQLSQNARIEDLPTEMRQQLQAR
jgi:mono/diheme cytochrome c family protein